MWEGATGSPAVSSPFRTMISTFSAGAVSMRATTMSMRLYPGVPLSRV